MTVATMAGFIGKTGIYEITNKLGVEVKVVDCRDRFGNLDVRITPVAGTGTTWVLETSMRFN